ncbi:MAG: hypothetical protein GTO45_35400, partial [Candidatus Aminicenantes bacterium]|nr:hypothetical protein [Candidatus Aminicenantes bacterium]NIM83966.1 hypothetical protein [Candidatus Aminicenantes bacterium]NIN23440.1 hypothetical protein [Candidatus Aminicenantes bacterium]NIN47145.1 hypothetical protein [Candidatus Aminicenantes bacterium]NIN90069.1 hypothetical protein [Candidatus Aminicenantes bacterium]
PRDYTFKVTACNPDGVWNEKGASLSFKLKPYFYQTTWFYFLAVLLVLLVGFTLYRFRVRQLRAREKELSTQVELRTRDLKERNIELEEAQQKIRHSKELIEVKNLQLEEQSEKLKELDKVKSRFFANISHEFRTPLTLIMGPLEQQLANCRGKQQEWELKMMLRNSQRLLNLINQLLELSKFESGKVKLQACRHNIIPFLKGIVASFDAVANKNELDLTFHPEEENITIYFDPGKLEDVIFNLLSNAVKFTPAGGKITVTVSKKPTKEANFPSGWLEISVCDTGPGILRNQLSHIFNRFYQLDSTYEHHQKGSGIGLAIAKELVELHHGKIDVHSREGKNSGTEFIIRLPLGDAHLKPEEIVEPSKELYKYKNIKEIPALDMIEKEPDVLLDKVKIDDSAEIDTPTSAEEDTPWLETGKKHHSCGRRQCRFPGLHSRIS